MGLGKEMELCWAMAEFLTADETCRSMEAGPGAFRWSPPTCRTTLAAGPQIFLPVKLTTFAGT